MHLRIRSRTDLEALARANHFTLADGEAAVFGRMINQILLSYQRLDAIAESNKPDKHARGRGHFPRRKENPFGAWAWKCSIKATKTGQLAGKKIAIKDHVSVAGIPMVNGSPLLEKFIPDEDATVVKRILEAGGEIVGKSRCENLCVSGGSHTSYPEPVRNPRNRDYMAGGSSSGSAALLASGEVDMAIGGDQGGSIRIPASWCGVVGLKPTWGLVPYTGAFPLERTIDHLGPMANSVEAVALLLEAIAGRDGLDTRQGETPSKLPRYSRNLRAGAKGLKIGVVKEGFAWEGLSEKDVDETVKQAASSFKELGAAVNLVSIPEHRDGFHVWTGITIEGTWNTVVRDNGLEHTGAGGGNPHLVESWAKTRKARSDELPPTMKLITLAGNYMGEKYNGRYFALAQNLRRWLKRIYDRALSKYDLLLMPTTPQKAQPLGNMGLEEYLDATLLNLYNTCPFDVSGHPAISIPCGTSGGLPVGLMLVGMHFEESSVLRAAFALEQTS